ncbi:hypothetical protein CBR_g53493 [Chara braunii]|uniref:Calmodulin n=1 Tax=Chara braunii TaxID=69332 RepID=A0A388MB51_CHABU|nr:hypothetical protein CBR_g53493 [Chara braunii]|eukprot:GBG91679.1 hypothetical protein CBR_g53493 [Chara braunii]
MNVMFQNFVNKTRLTQGMINFCVIVYMDDILAYSKTFHAHAQHIEWTLGALRDAGFKIALEKSEFFLSEISLLGYVVTRGGLRPDSRKVATVKDAHVPTSVTQVRAFLGLASYYRRFIKSFAAIARPLTNLLQKDQPLSWDAECKHTFATLKGALVTTPILIQPDPTKQFILITDWQPETIFAILAQKGNDGREHVIEYASRTVSHERRNDSAPQEEGVEEGDEEGEEETSEEAGSYSEYSEEESGEEEEEEEEQEEQLEEDEESEWETLGEEADLAETQEEDPETARRREEIAAGKQPLEFASGLDQPIPNDPAKHPEPPKNDDGDLAAKTSSASARRRRSRFPSPSTFARPPIRVRMYLLKKKRPGGADTNDHYVHLPGGDGEEEGGGGGGGGGGGKYRRRVSSTKKAVMAKNAGGDDETPLLHSNAPATDLLRAGNNLSEGAAAEASLAQTANADKFSAESSIGRDGYEGWDTGENQVIVDGIADFGPYGSLQGEGEEREGTSVREGGDFVVDVASLEERRWLDKMKTCDVQQGNNAEFDGWIDPVSDGWVGAGPPNTNGKKIWMDHTGPGEEKRVVAAEKRGQQQHQREALDGRLSDEGPMSRFSEELLMFLGRPPSPTYNPVNPFSSRTPRISGVYEWIKTIICLPLFILRVLLILLTIAVGYVWTKPILIGIENTVGPMPVWRRRLMYGTRLCGRSIMFALGFLWIHRKGRPAPRSIAPIVVSNHTSFMDPIFFFYDMMPTIVSSKSHEAMPLLGTIIKAMRVIAVDREDPNSRKIAASEIKRKASDPGWPRLLLFPEGTTTNGRAVVSFKLGAFLSGLPIQPVVIRYPHIHLDPSWGVDISMSSLLFRMMTQFYNILEVEYLPVIVPTEKEKANPSAYAERVRHAMAECLNAPCTDHTFGDVQLGVQATQLGLTQPSLMVVEMGRMGKLFNLTTEEAKHFLKKYVSMGPNTRGHVSLEKFLMALDLPITNLTKQIFYLFDRSEKGFINFQEFVEGLAFISKHSAFSKTVDAAFRAYDIDGDGFLGRTELHDSLKMVFPALNDQKVKKLFGKMDLNKDGVVSWEEFQGFLERNPEHLAVFVAARPDIMLAPSTG